LFRSALALALVSLPLTAMAQVITPGEMGVYFDLDATVYETTSTPYVQVSTYVFLTGLEWEEITGYRFGLEIVGAQIVTGTVFEGDGVTTAGDHGWQMELAAPLPTTGTTLLATFNIFILDSNPIWFTLSGDGPSAEGSQDLPAVMLEGWYWQPVCTPGWDPVGQVPGTCAVINGWYWPLKAYRYGCSGVVRSEARTWGSVKSMYR